MPSGRLVTTTCVTGFLSSTSSGPAKEAVLLIRRWYSRTFSTGDQEKFTPLVAGSRNTLCIGGGEIRIGGRSSFVLVNPAEFWLNEALVPSSIATLWVPRVTWPEPFFMVTEIGRAH